MQKQNGITLIALIITIIIMLILAGVTVAVSINGGLFSNAKKATLETRAAMVDELVTEWEINKEMYENRAQTLDELLDELESQDLITEEERTTIEETGQVTIGSRTIVFLEESIVKLRKIKIGDYVSYTPQTDETSYTIESKYSGYTSDQTYAQEDLKWRVLNKNEDGTIDLISADVTSTDVYFRGALGYNNEVYLLNDYCNKLYGNQAKGATSRSLNIEDIQNKMDLSVWDYHNYSGYGSITTYETYRYYPNQWKNEKSETNKIDGKLTNGTLGESEQNALTEGTYTEAGTSIEVTDTFWNKEMTESNFTDLIYYELFINNGFNYTYYWLASRYASASITSYSGFGLNAVKDGYVGGSMIFSSYTDVNTRYSRVRPVVSLSSNIIDTSTGDGKTADTAWGVK